jgi:hypothetical protein
MIREIERAKPPLKTPAPEGTWVQITFTLDTEHYHALWQRAEAERRTIPAFVRSAVMDVLQYLPRESTSVLAAAS